jgi:exopolysaccharide biosynthesis polyprenyl glycosylphosphotransferase
MKPSIPWLKYCITDYLAALVAYSILFLFRQHIIYPEREFWYFQHFNQVSFLIGALVIPFFWIFLYAFFGQYINVLRKSRLKEFIQTITVSGIGVLFVFFLVMLDDVITSHSDYYIALFTYFSLHFACTYPLRLIITTAQINRIREGKIWFPALIIGSGAKAKEIFDEIEGSGFRFGPRIIGYISIPGEDDRLSGNVPHMGSLHEIKDIIKPDWPSDVIIALEPSQRDNLPELLQRVELFNKVVRITPDLYDVITGKLNITTVFEPALMQVSDNLMPIWQQNLKVVMDVIFSFLVLLVLSPLSIVLALSIKYTSPGPVLYSHERIGKHGRRFRIYKFRSMFVDAEKNGPGLASEDDPRITSVGKFMREHRLDEIPNFINVIKGEMSLVGPRPERQFYIDQIVKRAPQYRLLHKVKPGITSWGQVKFGYAGNVDDMVRRMHYDLLYIENMSVYVDLQILLFTVITIIRGKGR